MVKTFRNVQKVNGRKGKKQIFLTLKQDTVEKTGLPIADGMQCVLDPVNRVVTYNTPRVGAAVDMGNYKLYNHANKWALTIPYTFKSFLDQDDMRIQITIENQTITIKRY